VARARKKLPKPFEAVRTELLSWPASARFAVGAIATAAVVGWAAWENQTARNERLEISRTEMREQLADYRVRFSQFKKQVEALELAADRQYPGVDGAKRLSKLIADVRQAKHLGAKERFVRPNARVKYETTRPIQQAILQHRGIAASFLIVARRGQPQLLKAADAFAGMLEFSGLTARYAEAEEKKGEPPGIRVYSSPMEERFVPDFEPGLLRYFRGPYLYEKVPQMEPGEVKVVISGTPLFLPDGTVLVQ
jgi:hypothetical protein